MSLGRRGTTFRAAAFAVLAMVSFTACGQPSGTPVSVKQELRVGADQDQYVLDGPRASLGSYPLNANIVETLTYLSPKYEVKPMLAERWEFRPPNTWRFFIRKGVKFHDGQALTADAVKKGLFERIAKIPGGGAIKAGPNSAVVVDEYTIDFTPTGANLRIPEQVVHPNNGGVVAPGSDLTKKPVGTGPFRFVEYRPKEQIVVERNPDYWGQKPKLDRITFRFFPDTTSRRLALEAGQVDAIFDVPRPDVRSLKDRGFQIPSSEVGSYEAMYANIHGASPHDILADQSVRQAIALAIDRKQLVSGLLEGLATTDQSYVPPTVLAPYQSRIKGFSYDPNRARSVLEQAGWKVAAGGIREKAGRQLHLQLVSGFPSAEVHRPIPTFLQSQLKQIGIDLEILERPDTASFQAMIDSGQGDLYLERGSQNDANPAFLPTLLFYAGGTGASASYQKLFAPGPAFDRLIEPTLTEPNADRVRQSTADALHYAIDEQAVILPLAGITRIFGLKKTVSGFVAHPSFLMVRWEGVSLTA